MSLRKAQKDNIAAVVTGNKTVDLRIWEVPELQRHAVGICGSDLKYWAYGKCGRFSLDGEPMVIGHEAAGVVAETGNDVKHLKPGDLVAIEPGVSCKTCDHCQSGRYNLCKEMRFCATPPVHGNLCRYYVHDADFCFKLPATINDEEGAMIEPLSVAIHTCRRADIKTNSHVIIFGAGPIGILCGLVAKQRGATQILTVDIDEHRLTVAKDLGATDIVYCVDKSSDDPEKVSKVLRSVAKDDGCHAALECSGADISLKTAVHARTGTRENGYMIGALPTMPLSRGTEDEEVPFHKVSEVCRPGGSVLLVGRGSPDVALPMVKAGTFEIDIKGIFRYANTYPEAIELVSSGAVNVRRLISHRFTLEKANDAFLTASDPHQRAMKVMIRC